MKATIEFDFQDVTLADLIQAAAGVDPALVKVDYAGCGTHAIELTTED